MLRNAPIVQEHVYHPYLAARYHLSTGYRRKWISRIEDVVRCPDATRIPRVPGAGKICGRYQIMHNGLKVVKDGYYAYPITRMLLLTGGVHEPQEEYAFGEVLRHMPAGAVMIELGAYWGFYSMWFNQQVPEARNFLVEPEPLNLEYGRRNFRANRMTGSFHRGYVGRVSGVAPDRAAIICVDGFAAANKIDFIDMLHADIQGFEMQMLEGADRMLREKKIGYCFISTHNEELHEQCMRRLADKGYRIVAEASPAHSYSVDGLIVAKESRMPGPGELQISKK
jgi:hypothetical protein